tara:strand:+ start:1285 stop:1506 length:222 start_codon:yes stop_codon:yes gene_type:complete
LQNQTRNTNSNFKLVKLNKENLKERKEKFILIVAKRKKVGGKKRVERNGKRNSLKSNDCKSKNNKEILYWWNS